MGTQKLALVQAAKTAKGAMVKYAMPNVKKAVAEVTKPIVATAKFTAGAVVGVYDAVKSTSKGLYQTGKYVLTTNPVQMAKDAIKVGGNIAKGAQYVYKNPKQVLSAVKSGVVNGVKAFAEADSFGKGRVVGRIIGEIGLAVVGTKGIDKLAKVAKGSKLLASSGTVAELSQKTGTVTSGLSKIDLQLFAKKGTGQAVRPAGEIFSKGYRPQSGERTLEGFIKNNVSADAEIGLYTKSPGFNNNSKGIGGQFKRIGVNEHAGISPHVHQPIRNVAPNGNIYGNTGRLTSNGGVTSPTNLDVKQLYDNLFNNKYRY